MKRHDDYTNEELLALSEDELETLIDLECAYDGVPLMPSEAPIKPEDVEVEPDRLVYEVAGLKFAEKETADDVAAFLSRQPQLETYYLNGRWTGPTGVRPSEEPTVSVSTTRYWTDGHYDTHRNQIEGFKVAKEAYDRQRKSYEDITGRRGEVATRIHERIGKAREDRDDRNTINVEFQRYLVLADNDHDVALKFYLNATSYCEELVREVLGFNLPIAE